ncbi:hypothetical protein IB211_03086 [Intestinimonas butyriciproducens]|uniref:Uncharacterized protein n=1 Tax=Intestinimonas butyriciproducens TaxID=1297617 RepID=A0A0S2W7Z0_9FIRM|nr:hypothetical protein IB211_03086 [Intestinimonas butyriciproducens]
MGGDVFTREELNRNSGKISIHAPRVGGDELAKSRNKMCKY